jgi:hypothetical protein
MNFENDCCIYNSVIYLAIDGTELLDDDAASDLDMM